MYLVRDIGPDSYFHACFFTHFGQIKDSWCCHKFFIFFLSALDRAFLRHSAILYCFWTCQRCASSYGTSLGNRSLYALAHGINETRPIISTMGVFWSISWTILSLLETPLCFLAYPLLINEGPSSKDGLSERRRG